MTGTWIWRNTGTPLIDNFCRQLNAWQEDIQSSNGLIAMNANLAIRGLTCASLQNISINSVLDVTSAFNAHVMDQHPHRLKTMSLTLRQCFVQAVKRYLINKVSCWFLQHTRYINLKFAAYATRTDRLVLAIKTFLIVTIDWVINSHGGWGLLAFEYLSKQTKAWCVVTVLWRKFVFRAQTLLLFSIVKTCSKMQI